MESADRVQLPYPIQFYFTEISNDRRYVQKFQTYGHQTHSILRNFSPDVDPCLIVERFIQAQLDRAMANARRNGHEPYWIGVAFRAEGMTEDFLVSWRHHEENRAGRIIGEFEKFHQSARRLELEDKPVHLRITIVADLRGAGYNGKVPDLPPAYNPDAIIEVPPRNDNLCLPVSIVVAMQNTRTVKRGDNERKCTNGLTRLLKNPNRQVKLAKALLNAAGLPDDRNDYGVNDIRAIESALNLESPGMYAVIIFTKGGGKRPLYKGATNPEHFLTLFHDDGHFKPVKSPGKLFGKTNYCACCELPYERLRDHAYNCPNRCHSCLGLKDGPGNVCVKESGVSITCTECNVTFHNYACYHRHKTTEACKSFVKCPTCGCKYRQRTKHQCGERYCKTCQQSMPYNHDCHIQKLKAPVFENYRVVTWDVETIQSKDLPDIVEDEDGNLLFDNADFTHTDKKPEHHVNTLCARVTCRDCINSGAWKAKNYDGCATCGPNRCRVWTAWNDGDVVDKFLNWICGELPKGYLTYAYAHNGGQFDNHFLMQKLCERGGEEPDIQATGNKIFQLRLKKNKTISDDVYFRDSYMILNMALEKVPDALGFKGPGLKKMFFPYLFNNPQNYHRQLNRLPNHKYYVPETMSKEKRQKFKKWYRANRKRPFELCAALEAYCASDVDILMEAMVRLHDLIRNELTDGIDLMPTFTTLAGLCQRVYRLKHYNLDDETPLAAFSETGYHKHDRQSTIAMKWLKWFGEAHNVRVQHRDTPDGETRIGKYKVDGYIPVAERNSPNFNFCDDHTCLYCYDDAAKQMDTVLEFQGCAYHGCRRCFKDAVRCPNGKMSDQNYARTEKKIKYLQETHNVIEMWECAVKEMLKKEEHVEMKQFFDDCIDTGPLDPREAFYGGRTGPSSLRFKKTKGYAIKYLDVNSLYPHVMRNEYPISHPSEKHRLGDVGFVSDVNWTKPADNPYRGVVKVRVTQPKHLAHPVLPVKHAKRLVFPLCRKCMEGSVDRLPHREPGCDHCEEERSWVGTYFTGELNLALSHGYRVDKLIEAWHWNDDRWTDKHFKGYVDTFVRMKTEATGWKKEILNADDPEKAKNDFVETYRQQGIHIRKKNMKPNPGRKTLSKMGANNLWGRFGLRPNMTKAEIVSKPSRLHMLLSGPQYEVKDVISLSDELFRVSYNYKEEFHPADPFGNVVVALITAAYGRMELFKYINMVDERMNGPKGSRVLYTDTDSVIFVYKINPLRPNDGCPIPCGKFLGDMEDEYPDDEIEEYVSAGNKQYALFLKNRTTGERWDTLKIRGITLDYRSSKKLNARTFRQQVKQYGRTNAIQLKYARIAKNKRNRVYTLNIVKMYEPYFRKAWIDKNGDIWPYGYVPFRKRMHDQLVSVPSTSELGYTLATNSDIFNPLVPQVV